MNARFNPIIRLPIVSSSPSRVIRQYVTQPPSYFSKHVTNEGTGFIPSPQNMFSDVKTPGLEPTQSSSSSRLSTMRDLSVIISILTLTFFAIDNYRARVQLEQKATEHSVAQMKSLAVAQNNFNNQRKKRELQVLNERKMTQKREMKMVYHIALLRKQLIEVGVKPVEIEEAIAEFEKNVKMETAISNVSGTALWVVDESPMKAFVPNVHDYENKRS